MLEYNRSIQAGDIIQGCHKGYWRVTAVVPRNGLPPIHEVVQVLRDNGAEAPAKTARWDASWSRKITSQVAEEDKEDAIIQATQKYLTIKKLLNDKK